MIEASRELPEGISLEDLEEHISAVRNERLMLQRLLDSDGWQVYCELVTSIAENHIKSRSLGPLTGVDDAFVYNYNFGISTGMRRSLALPEDIKSTYDGRLQQLEVMQQEMTDAKASPDIAEPGRAGGSESESEPELVFTDADTSDTDGRQFAP